MTVSVPNRLWHRTVTVTDRVIDRTVNVQMDAPDMPLWSRNPLGWQLTSADTAAYCLDRDTQEIRCFSKAFNRGRVLIPCRHRSSRRHPAIYLNHAQR